MPFDSAACSGRLPLNRHQGVCLDMVPFCRSQSRKIRAAQPGSRHQSSLPFFMGTVVAASTTSRSCHATCFAWPGALMLLTEWKNT